MSSWTLFSNHGHVLVCLARDSEARLRDVAADVGITERAVQKIVRDLQDGGMISITKNGRRNSYRIHKKQSLRHKLEAGCTLRELIRVVNRQPEAELKAVSLANEPAQVANSKPESSELIVEARQEPESESRSIEPEPIKPTKQSPENEAGSKESSPPDSLERQQGSLF